MAIKERKQITGTTAQIQDYAGHEGQIVWDKDKKTFVGMSGTAGKNYPLAQQAYVDTQFLPLTGGTLTGALNLTKDTYIKAIVEDAYKGLEISGGPTANKGANLVLRNDNATASGEAGLWGLLARNGASGQESFLLGTPAGSLTWAGKEVLRVTGIGSGWVRFNPNIQICFGEALTTSEGFATVSYGAPFSNVVSITATILGDSYAAGVNWGIVTRKTSGSTFTAYAFKNGVLQPTIYFSWCAFGYY